MKHVSIRPLLAAIIIVLLSGNIEAQVMLSRHPVFGSGVIPTPKQDYSAKEYSFKIDSTLTVSIEGAESEKLTKAVNRFYRRLGNKRDLFLKPIRINYGKNDNANIVIRVERTEDIKQSMDESYNLLITETKITLESNTDIGAIRGLQTLIQLFNEKQGSYYFTGGKYTDAPYYPWRGLLMDACRHFMPVETIKRNIDGLEAAKMNVLHWHLSEDQGFRVECKTFPKLHELGSYGDYYTQEQIKDVIKYANDRGIRVVPEFDIPGHSTAWFVGYPEYASAPGPYEIEKYFGVFDPCFDPTKESTYEFFDKFFAEMSQLFNDEYIHIGGDENEGKQWDANANIQAFMKKNGLSSNHELQAYFNKRIQKILTKYGKKMIGWDEIYSEDLPKDIVIHSWRGKESMINAAKHGYSSILSSGYYIDLCQSMLEHFSNSPGDANGSLTETERKRILGGEATMWAELVTDENVDSRIWPRTAAIAQILWTGTTDVFSRWDTTEIKMELYMRFRKFSNYLSEIGLRHNTNKDAMLKRFTWNGYTNPLRTYIDFIEPIKYYNRHKYRKYTQFTPLNRFVDIASPDAPLSIEFNYLVYLIVNGKANGQDVDNTLSFLNWVQSGINNFNLVDLYGIQNTELDTWAAIERYEDFISKATYMLSCIKNKKQYMPFPSGGIFRGPEDKEIVFPAYSGLKKLENYLKEGRHLK